LKGENGKYTYSKSARLYPPFFDIPCSTKNYKIEPALTLGTGNNREYVAVKMDGATLVFDIWKHFPNGLQYVHAFVSNDQFYAIQPTATEPLEETDPTGLVLLHALSGPQNLTVSVLIYCNRNIFVLSAPIAPQVDTVHVDIQILSFRKISDEKITSI